MKGKGVDKRQVKMYNNQTPNKYENVEIDMDSDSGKNYGVHKFIYMK